MLLHQQIELQATRTPDAVAVRYAGKSLSYAELDQRANRCARYLRELGAGPDVIIGLLMERSLEMMVALLGILKSGGAYLPIDPSYPQARLDFLLDDAGVAVVVTQPGLAGKLGQFGGTVLPLDLEHDALAAYDCAALELINEPDDLAYVIYTSGSTGQPKGCMLTHRAICNRLDWMQDKYRLSGGDRVLQKTPYTFDVSVWEFFWPLLAGATLVLAKPQGHKDSHYLSTTIRQEGITVCHFVPSMLRFFLDDAQAPQCTSLRDVFTSGEALSFELVRRFKELLGARLHNLYGPTEAAVDVSYWECEIRADKIVPIGRAITNIDLHVLDESRNRLARGQEGELYIAGVGLARGYLNRPELSDERFVPNPFGQPGSRMYRTGDRVRELDDGNIEFLGRVDFQVKLRGLRIELGEIEAALHELPGVNEVVVLVRGEEDGDPKLVAYLEPGAGEPVPQAKAVRDFVRTRLPEYMVPNVVAVLERLPVTAHGKLDRNALPWPVAGEVASAVVAKAGEVAPAVVAKAVVAKAVAAPLVADVRPQIAEFVAGLLKCAKVDHAADLFDLGATSLTLVRLAEWIGQEYGVEVPVEHFLDAPTVQGIAAYVIQAGGRCEAAPAAPAALAALAAPAAPAAPAVPPPTVADCGMLTKQLRDFIATVLRCSELADDADLFDLGATSLSLVRVAEWIGKEFGIEVPVEVFLDAPTVNGIAGYLRERGAGVRAVPAATVAEPAAAAKAGQLIALPPLHIRSTAYLPPAPDRFAGTPIDFANFSAWLMLLGAEEQDGRQRYLHPSGGGLNSVRTYVAVKPDAVPGLADGVYYFHPVAHTLHRVGEVAGVDRAAFGEIDQAAFDSAAAAVFFVAALDAIAPLYQQTTGILVTLDAGYMGQLLMSRQGAHGLETRPLARVDFDRIAGAFQLEEGERFVHCLLAGAPLPAAGRTSTTGLLKALQRNAPAAVGRAALSHCAIAATPPTAPLSKEMTDQLHHEQRHLRNVAGLPAAGLPATGPFAWDDYRLRACRRDYDAAALPLSALAGLLALSRIQPDGAGAYLHGSVTGRPAHQLYLYARGGRIEGLAEGLYRYDEQRHTLILCSDFADAAMVQAYTPYNRKHYKAAAFSLFVVAPPYDGLNEDEAIHWPLLEAGYLGQLLMDRQAEFDLGLCPIGGMRFDLVRAGLQLPEGAVLLHSFTGGMFHQEIPAGRQTLAELVRSTAAASGERETFAIVGLSGRYPGAEALEGYWENLKAGVSSIALLPAERQALLAQGSAQSLRAGGYLGQIDCFDSLLFGISPAEARALDPQERLLLESAWTCLEDAGYTAETLLRDNLQVGVFIGAMWNDYQSHGAELWESEGRVEEFSHHASLANRISFLFNFSGPSVAINTSCSSGMTALHFACESIRRGECDVALVGGVNLVSHAYHARLLETIDFLSKEDTCRPFSAQANGWILGEGVGTVLIKPAAAAQRQRDHVYALIKGSAIGHSGRTMRYGAPSAKQQERIMRLALANAGVGPDDIDYLEAAAPGAGMADAAEMSAVKAVFGARKTGAACLVGTVKANVGHLESASLFSQLTKVLYQMRDWQFAPSLNSRPRNPLIALDPTSLSIVEQLTPWPRAAGGRARRAMINAIGAAGSEGHLVLEEYVDGARRAVAHELLIVPLSAATEPQLRLQAQQLLDFLQRAPDARLDDLAFTLQLGRVAMAERLALLVPNTDALRAALTAWLAGEVQSADTWRGRAERGAAAAPSADDLRTLAQHWVQGGKLDWYGRVAGDPRRLALPTYPFERVRHWIGRSAEALPTPAPALEHAAANTQLHERVLSHLLRLVAGVTEVPVARLDADAPLEGYGLNSLMVQNMNAQLEEAFGALSKTLFFEVRTVRQLAEHLVEHHREAASRRFGAGPATPVRSAESKRAVQVRTPVQPGEGIAIVGLSGRYPKARTLREYWANLTQGVDCISEIPPERWDHARHFDSVRGKPGKTYSKWGGFIDGVAEFDPMFFGMTPREAAMIDPQERLFLQTAWHALEDAGYTRASLGAACARRVGVFVGVMYGEYQLYPSLEDGLGVSGSYGTIANRVSYVLDLHGPSMAIDTMCSSSLTAMHLACESIRRGECEAAIAGGVNLSLHPNKYVTHALLGMAAGDGRCRSFGAGGDGFVPGEGVGAVLLKPLSRAIADGDQIYGVIKGSAVNHGGRTNGFTVPDPRAQAELIRAALASAGVAPSMVSYIEAHGTGTELGDPIEIAGLVQAFGETMGKCAIGSAKSNIGHCESAAGIAGLTKVLLQMRHQTLVKSLHSEELNANIDFASTPFAVQTETAPWPQREYPRIAGISSFGAGGANAHLVIEEYVVSAHATGPLEHPVAVVLSAKTAEALREQAVQLCAAIAAGELADAQLADAAYTLQVGREAMDYRLACMVQSTAALQAALDGWLAGGRHVDGLQLGQVKRGQDSLAAFAADEDMAGALDAWIAKGKLDKLLDLWVKGLVFDWARLYGDRQPRRIGLPTYPFAREHYWVQPAAGEAAKAGSGAAVLHPLLHRNTSDLSEQRFSTRLTGAEFFLADHVVQGRRVLPGVAHLEMARAALVQSGAAGSMRLAKLVWLRPVVVEQTPLELHIGLYPEADGQIAFEIYSDEDVLHSQGRAETFTAAPERIDLAAMRAQCGEAALPGADLYARYAALGLAYGPAHQAIEVLHAGVGLALARLRLPPSVAASAGDYVLHPSLLDAALQAVAGLASADEQPRLALPFGVDAVEIMGACGGQMWALVKASGESTAQVRKYDVTLCDDDGLVAVRFNGFETRMLDVQSADGAVLLLKPEWQERPADGVAPPQTVQHHVLVCEGDLLALTERMAGAQCRSLAAPDGADLAAEYGHALRELCASLQAILQGQPSGPVLVQVVVPTEGPRQALAGLAGALKSARQEQPLLIAQLIAVDVRESADTLAAALLDNARCPQDADIRYVAGRRQVAAAPQLVEAKATMPWRAGGVYLITGALGGLGQIFAAEIARQAAGVTLVLSGRRALDEAGRQQLRTLEALGAKAEYRAVDVADRDAVQRLVQETVEAHGGLNGIVHTAGVVRDSFLVKKTAEEIDTVLSPKVAGLINLDEASQTVDLDWLICFSSISAVLGNVGQADYAAANGFMDRYVGYRNLLALQGQRKGRAVALNWPLWREGGMRIDAAHEARMERQTGLRALGTQAGINALYRVLASGQEQLMVLEGAPERLRQLYLAPPAPPVVPVVPVAALDSGSSALHEKAVHYFKKLLARVFKLPVSRVEADAPLERYGIDSILVAELTQELEQVFGPLSKSLLFEYQTLDALAGYFLGAHHARLAQVLKAGQGAVIASPAVALAVAASVPTAQTAVRRKRSRFALAAPLQGHGSAAPRQDIAIIGLSGSYPQARNLQTFWDNLVAGRDSITEVPLERWDHSRYFDPDKNRLGTTYSKWGGFIDGADEFDPRFFNIAPRDAQFIDPQERLFLQCVYGALEDAGYTGETLGQGPLARNVGVYAGVFFEEYQLYGAQEQARGHHVALSGSPASIANRVSYHFNFQGPSLTVDTMCSASLTAIHIACENLRNGSCSVAVAGGVNLTIHPNKYLLLAQSKFASSKGRCESFGEGGDGYVPGEGVGAVILKPLQQAVADGDHIYGVIKAASVNHGGKTNGYTVPNPHAQAEVVARAIKESGLDPRSISYIEAHGTGTALGDPIEIAGLVKAFGGATQERQFCAIGSVKSNIGHCEAAAGIAGVTKVLLQMKHGQLAPSLHAQILNPNIDFGATPFAVQRELAQWKRPLVEVDGKTVEVPRRAGISSFGAGGSNAHVIIEEYVDVRGSVAAANPALVVLSARNAERLQERVQQLLATLDDDGWIDERLADLAYTLQVGREAMEERLALLVNSVAELKEKLAAYLAGEDGIDDLYRGQVKQNKDALAVFTADDDLTGAIDAWIAKGKQNKLLDLWVKGLAFDWNKLYGDGRPRRVSLPTYPFARERYWVPRLENPALAEASTPTAVLHPLLHRNTSRLAEQRFSTRLTGREFFLADHVVQGKPMLPGVAYLEMAREALAQAEAFEPGATGVRLKNVVWTRPLAVDGEAVDLHIALQQETNGAIGFEVYSGDALVHSQGTAESFPLVAVPRIDLASLRAQCGRAPLPGGACYAGFATLGLAYGPAFQAIECIYQGDGQALARLRLPAGGEPAAAGFVLHPSLLDAALQATAGLTDVGQQAPLALPFGLEAVEILGRCSAQMWALVTASGDSTAQVRKYDVTLCDDEGVVCVRLKGYATRVVEGKLDAGSVLLLQPDWQEKVATDEVPHYEERHVVLCAAVAGPMDGARCIELAAGSDLAADYGDAVQRLCAEVQAIMQRKPAGPVLLQVVVPAAGPRQMLDGLAGVLKTARLEQPKLVGQLIAVEEGDSLAAKLAENAACPNDVVIRYAGGRRQVAGWQEITAEPQMLVPWKADGVYLITGGMGGLGQLLAEEIAQRARGVTLVLTGRRELDESGRQHLRSLEALGATVAYRPLDVADREAVRQLVLQVQEEYQALHGIVHAAGVLRDSLLLKKTAEEIKAVLAPKVAGLLNLDEASRDIELDWLICFSSTSAALGNVGQADYAAANGFMDSFAQHRNELAAQGLRQGRAVSVNWPLWQHGGMQMDAASAQRMEQHTGLKPLASAAGIEALYRVLGAAASTGLGQAMVLQGAPGKIRQRLLAKPDMVPARVAPVAAVADAGLLQDKIKRMLMHAVSALLKLKLEDIDGDVELSEFGFDSISLTEFGNRLNQDYAISLTPTIFFEYPTLSSFSEYLCSEHRALFTARLMSQGAATAVARPAAPETALAAPRAARARPARAGATVAGTSEPIAIIGMSGCFPMARDLDEFWDNLRGEKDCISEIPADRWDWRQLFGNPQTERNKTSIKWGGFIDGVDEFDPLFFGISPKEAEVMDPQQRLLMTYVWKAIEDAGYAAASLSGSRTAIYVGTGSSGYGNLIARAGMAIEGYSATGMVPSVGPNRMSYLLNLRGPSEPVETACSSSLIALRKGVLAIQNGGCELAIVGGVSTIVSPEAHISFNKAGMLSEDGRCKTFSKDANGYVRGEGAGMLVLKRLSAAERDGDHIYGLIRGTAENHGGRASSLTAPNPKAQADLLKDAYQSAGVDPRSVSYIEAHGTGTPLGDPIEVNGLKMAFKAMYQDAGAQEPAQPHCALGSVKTNIGHLELAAGVAGVIKVLLQLQHKTLVKSLHCDEVNPYIDLQGSPFYVVRQTQEWPALQDAQGGQLPRRAGVSSFGFGGVNAHVVIEEYQAPAHASAPHTVTSDNPALVVLSAKNVERLREQARQLLAAIVHNGWGDERLAELAYTLQVGRDAMEERLAVPVHSMAQLQEKLAAFVAGEEGIEDLYRGQLKRNKEALAVFTADEELQEAIAKWVERKKYAKVLDLWVKGLVFDWSALYGENRPQRMSLPSYAFARDRYWVTETETETQTETTGAGAAQAMNKQAMASHDESFYHDMLDRVMDGSVSVEAAAREMK